MSEEEIAFLSLAEAVALVGAIQEEEDISEKDKRILTVYSADDRELCWFDFAEVLEDLGAVSKEDEKEAVQNYVLARIPAWAREI
ncbi:hypothetical protein [Desulfotalea psychrophila]|uniref:Uncharacterized protein n=1 Tax=Desulfotalea psychrophila (strain LSv54 / DSM 12343) TaxID=177439 RepID=Q6AML2_DESPS|nr:hypothetical protein [Desulfotalea psychrophila]CAG36413.1 unknown protein [Desulfotalea psychrophila LSv54]